MINFLRQNLRHRKHALALYIYPVLCCVYRLRREGQRLSPDEVKQTKALGYLKYGKRGGWPTHDATLRDSDGELLLELMYCSLVKIERGGILMRGREPIDCQSSHPQTWWILPMPA